MDPPTRPCRHCGQNIKLRGIGSHEKACHQKQLEAAQSKAFTQQLRRNECTCWTLFMLSISAQAIYRRGSLRGCCTANSSGLPPQNCSLDEYLEHEASRCQLPSTDQQPWLPFRTRLDFEVAEFSQENMLNRAATNKLIALIRRCAANLEEFTIKNYNDMNKQWEAASKECTNVSLYASLLPGSPINFQFGKYDVVVPYKETLPSFEMFARPLWSWTLDLIRDPCLAPCFIWDAVKMYRHNGRSFVRFWNEPWTAAAFWEIQSLLPNHEDAKLCSFIIYADKSKLSSFGTQKAYPIIARLGNLVVGIRNGNGWGGGQVVGELPIVADDTVETKKKGYVDFKNAVWHKSFFKLLESIAVHSKTGVWTKCGDGKTRWLFPVVLILAADYEEASVMTLIRGVGGNYPCPICLVGKDEQSDLTLISDLRTAQASKAAVEKVRKLTSDAGEELLKDLGLRKVDNVFWRVAYSDPHHAVSFDRLHSHHSGLWGDHLFPQLKLHLMSLGARQSAKLDQQFNSLPPWHNLNHFQTVTNISFNDSSKHEDIAKMMVHAAQNILTSSLGLKLLKCICAYLELDLHVGLELHTTDTIAAGHHQLQTFNKLLKEYRDACIGTEFKDKNWEFAKAHLHAHAFDDIVRKGVSKNFGTKIDESMHGAVRAAYQRQTNFKDVQPQILCSLHRRMVGKFIREQLEDLDKFLNDDDLEHAPPPDLETLGNTIIGAKQKPISFVALEAAKTNDTAFTRFQIRFADFLNMFLPAYGHPLPRGKRVAFVAEQEIIPYQFLKIHFKSLEHWLDDADFLRCNPCFHNRERYDAALVKTTAGNIFVRLAFVFTCEVGGKIHPFALVRPLDVRTGQRTAKDKALGLHRVRQRERKNCEFISAHSIIRGALLVPDFDKKGDYFVVDVVDADMYFRLKAMYPERAVE
ncbi:hypothetical protein C8R45DRAFT_1050416 [Mycena sanguinolenta]|nr:hypothetical protein C8R45DRAFT_1050416 [Mycena sanguinolenta]